MIQTERPLPDGRPSAVFVLNALRPAGGRLAQLWLARLRAFDAAGWATHAALVNRDAVLSGTVDRLVADGQLPAATSVHHFAVRDRRLRAPWRADPGPDGSPDPLVGDWLDWLTAAIPGAVVVADSPATYPYLAAMTNPLVARAAGIHLNHLTGAAAGTQPALAPMTPRFAARFEPVATAFDALVVMTHAQAADLRTRLGPARITSILPSVPLPRGPAGEGAPVAGGQQRIVAVGTLEDASRHDEALIAVAPVLLANAGSTLEIVGEGQAGPGLVALAERLGVADRVRIVPPLPDEHDHLRGAGLLVWTGRRESCPLAIVRALACGVPVVAYDVRYGPADLLGDRALGTLVPSGDVTALQSAVAERLAGPVDPAGVLRAAAPLLAGTHPDAVGRAWVALFEELSARVHAAGTPVVLVEGVRTSSRVLRLPAVLASPDPSPASWTIELPGLVEPAGWLVAPDDAGPDAPAGTRPVVLHVRSNALAHVATGTREPYPLELTDGVTSFPLRSLGFEPRVVAARTGAARLERHDDGTAWIRPLTDVVAARAEEGRVMARLHPGGPASDVTHAVEWRVSLAWADLRPGVGGVALTGILATTAVVPDLDCIPSICVPDVGGYSRVVGSLHRSGEPTVDGTAWSVPVAGVIEADPLVATTQLARSPLVLHVGFAGMIVRVGTLQARGGREALLLSCPRGEVTLLPTPGGRVLAAPGRGVRARVSVAVRSLVGRG